MPHKVSKAGFFRAVWWVRSNREAIARWAERRGSDDTKVEMGLDFERGGGKPRLQKPLETKSTSSTRRCKQILTVSELDRPLPIK